MSFLKITLNNGEILYRSNGFPEFSKNINYSDSEISINEEIKNGEVDLINSFNPLIRNHACYVLFAYDVNIRYSTMQNFQDKLKTLLNEYLESKYNCNSLFELMKKIENKYGVNYESKN